MKVTVLIENSTKDELLKEHGLALYIEHMGKVYLLDAGETEKFVQNAKSMNVSLEGVDKAVLSHHHYDHAGGYRAFLSENDKADIYIRKTETEDYYIKKWFLKKYIGIPLSVQKDAKDRFVRVEGKYLLDDGVWLLPHTAEGMEEKARAAYMYMRRKGCFTPDDFMHEQSLVFETPEGLVIFNSCCHGGVDTIVREVMKAFQGMKVAAVIGGFHLVKLAGGAYKENELNDIRELGRQLNYLGVQKIYTGHCTGDRAYGILKEELGEKLNALYTGMVFEV